MTDLRFLFSTGTARGGTGILVQTLGVHSEIELSLDAFTGVYRSLRNDLVGQHLNDSPDYVGFDPNSPLDDYYFSDATQLNRTAVNAGLVVTGTNGTGLLLDVSIATTASGQKAGCSFGNVSSLAVPSFVQVQEMLGNCN